MGVTKPDIAAAFNMPPRRAIEFFESKGNVINWDWYETWQTAHSKAFTVAKAMKAEILQDFHDGVRDIFVKGDTYEEFRRKLEPKLKAAGWWGKQKVLGPHGEEDVQLGSPWRLKRIYQTNAATNFSAGRWRQFVENADARPYLQYLATLDGRTRPTHRAMHGKVFRIDDPIWKYLFPPNDWGCRCRVRALSQADVERMGLIVEDGSKAITHEERLVSAKTGEVKPVAVYTDPATGKRMATGVGWSYNPGMKDFEPDLSRITPAIAKAYRKEVAAAGLTQRYPVTSYGDIETLLKAYDKETPGIFQLGFKSIEITNAKYIMATNAIGEIKLSRRISASGFNGAENLLQALRKVSLREALSFDEEYAIEALWHEIGHCRMQGWMKVAKGSVSQTVMETLNQWVARHTYSDFLAQLGGKAAHQEKILAEGVGYQRWVANLRTAISALGVNEQTALGVIKPLVFRLPWTKLQGAVAYALARLSNKDEAMIKAVLGDLSQYPGTYTALLKALFKTEG